ncbi:MAG: DUF4339 domain-containing protein [Sedimentisphaerales bacterium]|nr:DUF4339 domain-containing protein [Sedimentisphaerales bacterium]
MDEQQWYYAIGQQQYGPVSATEIKELFQKGNLGTGTYVWTDGFADWRQASDVEAFTAFFSNQPAPSVPYTQATEPARTTSVTVFGILNIVFGGLGAICTPFSLIASFNMPDVMNPSKLAELWLIFGSILGLACSALLIALGIGLLNLKAWARKCTLYYGWLAVVWNIIGTLVNLLLITSGEFGYTQDAVPGALGGTCGGLVGGLIYPIFLIVFMQKQNVKSACVN